MAVISRGGDEQQLAVRSGTTVRVLARDMSSGTSFELPGSDGLVVAGEQFLYVNGSYGDINSLTHDGAAVASYKDPDKSAYNPVLAPDGLLFCVLFDEDDDTLDEIVALNAQTLQPRYRFGLSLLNDVRGMVVVGEELFVCDRNNDRIQVFSLAGMHRRSVTGEWKQPSGLCLVEDCLYLVEEKDDNTDKEGELINPLLGRRIFVLSLQGDTLQVFTNPVEGQAFSDVLCCFDGMLLVPVLDAGRSNVLVAVMALRGV